MLKLRIHQTDEKSIGVSMGLEKTVEWFEVAIPEPTIETACVQIGCAYEETSELSQSIGDMALMKNLDFIGSRYKSKMEFEIGKLSSLNDNHKIKMLDAIVDEIVTRVGIAHNMGFDIIGALDEVNRSNFSKFENGSPIFNEKGKIDKGVNYTPPNLKPYI